MLKTTITFILFSFLSTLVFSQENVFDEIAASPDHTIFTELLELTDVDEFLKDDDYYSVFVPDDMAFESVFSPEELDSLKLDEAGTLRDLVLHHLVADTVEIGFSSEYLPMYGNQIIQFIDGAGNVLIVKRGRVAPDPVLKYPSHSNDVFKEVDNGRILWMVNNYIVPLCVTWQEVAVGGFGIFGNAIEVSELEDTIDQSEAFRTFILADEWTVNQHILDNGGFSNTPFLDSFVRRHVLEGFYPFQDIYDGLTIKNMLGETYLFNVVDDEYYINSVLINDFVNGKNGVGLLMDTLLLETEYSSVTVELIDDFKVFPNPASHEIELQVPQGDRNATVSIFTFNGQEVLTKRVTNPITRVDIRSLRSGPYIAYYQSDSLRKTVMFMKGD